MKKSSTIMAVLAVMLSVAPISSVFAAQCQDNPFDKMGDWAATMGKQGMDKDTILASRKAKRAAACAERMAKQASKDAGKAAADAKKKLGF